MSPILKRMLCGFAALAVGFAVPARGQPAHEAVHLPPDSVTHHLLTLAGHDMRFTATAGSLRLRDGKDAPLAEVAYVAYRQDGADAVNRPVTFVFNGGPGMASAWLQMGAISPWRVRIETATDTTSSSPVPVANPDTWLDLTDLVFIDPPGTGYSRIVSAEAEARRHLWSVGGDIDALTVTIRKWLDQNGRNVSPKYLLGESYGGFRAPRLVRKLSEDGVSISGMILLSPLLDAHLMSGYADPLGWVDLLPSEVAVARSRHGAVVPADLVDVEAYAGGEYLVDILRGSGDAAAIERLTARVSGLTGLDPGFVRRLDGRLDRPAFQREAMPGRIGSLYDGTITRPSPDPRALAAAAPDPVLNGWEAPVTGAMMAVYQDKLNWRPDSIYHLSNDAVFGEWDWGHGIGRPESLSALQAARSLDPRMRVLIGHGMFDLVTPYFASVRILRLLPPMPGAEPIRLRLYSGGHMFYFDDASRAALHSDAKTVFDPPNATEESR